MRSVQLVLAAAFAALIGATAHADGVTSIAVGQNNPFFPSTGGDGQVASFDQPGQKAVIEKTFDKLGDVPIIIDRGPSSGVDTIHIDERVRNDTGVDWTDFHFIFESIDANPGLTISFLNVANPTGEWSSGAPGPNTLSLFGLVPAGDVFSISFDLQMTDQVDAYALFGVHEVPSVPEPTTVALLGLGLVPLAVRRRSAR